MLTLNNGELDIFANKLKTQAAHRQDAETTKGAIERIMSSFSGNAFIIYNQYVSALFCTNDYQLKTWF